jgi:hypothetical protein
MASEPGCSIDVMGVRMLRLEPILDDLLMLSAIVHMRNSTYLVREYRNVKGI